MKIMKKFAPAAKILEEEKAKAQDTASAVDTKTDEMTDKLNAEKEAAVANSEEVTADLDKQAESTIAQAKAEAAAKTQELKASAEEKVAATEGAAKTADEAKPESSKEEKELFANITPPSQEPPKGSVGKKAATGVAAVLLALGAGYGYTKYEESAKEKDQVKMEQKMALTETHLDQLYLNEQKVFLSKNFDMTKLADVTKEIDSITDEKLKADLKKQLAVVTEKAEKQNEVNNLFQAPIMVGDEISDKVYVKSDLTKVPSEVAKPKDEFEKAINKALGVADKQVKELKEVKDAVAKVVDKEGKALKSATLTDVEAAKKLVDGLKDKDLKEKLTSQLEKAEKAIKNGEATATADKDKADKEKEKAEKEKAEKEKAAANQAEKEKATNQGASNNNASGNEQGNAAANANNQGSQANTMPGGGVLDHGANDDGGVLVKDGIVIHGRTPGSTLEGDWSWAPGVQENFINTAIARGYVAPGGYELRAKEIINGEAYYELYATRRDTALTQGFSDSQLPIYLVTVNAKTGSFRGGASNYSDAR